MSDKVIKLRSFIFNNFYSKVMQLNLIDQFIINFYLTSIDCHYL